MSRKSPTDQLADDIGCLIIGLMWVAIVGFFTLLFKSTQVSPEDQLLKLQPGYAWLWRIEKKDCPDCGTANESYVKRCNQCGANLVVPVVSEQQASTTKTTTTNTTNDQQIVIAAMVLIVLFVIILGIIASQGG